MVEPGHFSILYLLLVPTLLPFRTSGSPPTPPPTPSNFRQLSPCYLELPPHTLCMFLSPSSFPPNTIMLMGGGQGEGEGEGRGVGRGKGVVPRRWGNVVRSKMCESYPPSPFFFFYIILKISSSPSRLLSFSFIVHQISFTQFCG